MAISPLQVARVSNLLRTSMATQSITTTQQQLLVVQNELTTGKKVNAPSDDPAAAAAVMQLQKAAERRKTFAGNIDQAKSQLGEVDSALGDLGALLQQAQTIASANVGSDVSADDRAGAAAVVDQLYQQALGLGNRQLNGTYLFAGDRATDPPFVAAGGGVKFVGSSAVLQNEVDENTSLPFMVDGAAVFGATSTRVRGTADLSPQLSAADRLADLRGATGNGVRPGLVQLGNGTTTALVDLSGADTVGDVVAAINAAGVGGITAAVAGGGITLSTAAADDITIADVGGGTAAADLGILRTTGAGAGAPLAGANTAPRVTPLTQLSDLRGGLGIDTASGIVLHNGAATATVAFTSPPLRSPATVEDLLNAINHSGVDVVARVNADGTGIDLVNPNQGTQLTVAENGGTTAADLGVRSLSAASTLADLNGGAGVRTAAGDDLQITRTDGTTFAVDLDGAATVQDVIDKINAADTAGGTVPATVTAAVAATGNGITLTDAAGGGGTLQVAALNFSEAAADLGLAAPAAATATSLTGADTSAVGSAGVFASLAKLRDALRANDQAGITAAGEGLTADADRVTRVRGETGARVQDLESRADRLADQGVAADALLSNLQDVDFTEAISRFQALQTALQATLQASGKTLNLSLMDFLG